MYYRCCWHMISSPLFIGYSHKSSSPIKAVYNTNAFVLHVASLHQAFAHCGRFSTAATRRCLGRVSVPVLGSMLSHPLPVIALVSHYLTNKLIGRRHLSYRKTLPLRDYRVLDHFSMAYPRVRGSFPRVINPFAADINIRSTCMPYPRH